MSRADMVAALDRLIALVEVSAEDFSDSPGIIRTDHPALIAAREALAAEQQRDMPDPDYAAAEHRAELFEPGPSGAELEDELRDRSENIAAAREAAFERGQDYYECTQNTDDRDEAAARYYDKAKLQRDFCDGWDAALQDDVRTV